MIKIKTKSSAKKRFKKLSSGLIKRPKAYHRHLLTKKSIKRKRSLRTATYVSSVDFPRIKQLMPY